MFIGHFGVGLGLKRAAPAVSLGTLFLAAQFVDLLWPTLLLLGVERVEIVSDATGLTPLHFVHYPITHSLLAVLGWGALFALAYGAIKRSRIGAIVCAVAVISHWDLDFLVHRPDLPLYPGGGPLLGLGLWNTTWATLVLELAIFVVGLFIYCRMTRAVDRVGTIGFWSLIGFLMLIYFANLFGPPPPSVKAIAWAGQAQWLLILWAYWVDRHRRSITGHATY